MNSLVSTLSLSDRLVGRDVPLLNERCYYESPAPNRTITFAPSRFRDGPVFNQRPGHLRDFSRRNCKRKKSSSSVNGKQQDRIIEDGDYKRRVQLFGDC
ncbi:5443_t:CDS:2 [Paraglomus occultum]|uniref:5443_t:CDS:1 n=1 Tax=Paraglomus occultum TaxID=144539 RepID=A0A9N9GEJ5_9GLOM|nr:5443_t:CDS:2 [Paraglomus occultum]